MDENFTLIHALSKNSIPDLKKLAEKYNSEERINPNAGKPKIIEDLIPVIPTAEREKIIDRTFNTPKTRYTAHLGVFKESNLSPEEIEENCSYFNSSHDFSETAVPYQSNYKEEIELISFDDSDLLFHYTFTVKKPEYDFDSMESRPVIYSRKIRVVIKPEQEQVSVFTGDRDLFNNVLTALTNVFGKAVAPLDINKTGISNSVSGSFSFHTVKVIDFIYHGLEKIGTIGAINQIELETVSKSKKPQKVRVQGDDLLDDKSICEYLFIYGRDLVGVKLEIKLPIGEGEHLVNVEIGVRDNRIKIGIKKDHFSLESIKEFYELVENNTQKYMQAYGLINEQKTINILDKIRSRAISTEN
jgi:hypothetical protein